MFKINNIKIDEIVLAPLAGYTNKAYRKIMKEAGIGLVYTEMISAKGLLYNNDKTWELTEIDENEHPIALQLFGGERDDLVNAAMLVDKRTNCDIIDINMGCPVKKVLNAEAGSKLLKDPNKIYDIVSAITKNVQKPVSVKIRAGWDHKSINCFEVARNIERAGASFITIHGRTKTDVYGGKANLDFIKMVKDAVSIPVIGNGDIRSIEDAVKMKEYTKVDALMIGRGSLGNPWLITELVNHFNNAIQSKGPSCIEKIEKMLEHFNLLCELKGERIAVLEMRSLAAWYVKGIENAKEFKQSLLKIMTKAEFISLVDNKLLLK